ncbi:MAG: twin-arginine translocation signal domain-containing protein, partial [Candidatus Saccharibacteria bacterium]|nr:twin-arginine translocation signal domain-containing protein [Pseudorhodobacter sp.]
MRRPHSQPDIRTVISERVSRRGFLLGTGATMGAVVAGGFVGSLFSGAAHAQDASSSL